MDEQPVQLLAKALRDNAETFVEEGNFSYRNVTAFKKNFEKLLNSRLRAS